jgi:hypothetical protein
MRVEENPVEHATLAFPALVLPFQAPTTTTKKRDWEGMENRLAACEARLADCADRLSACEKRIERLESPSQGLLSRASPIDGSNLLDP